MKLIFASNNQHKLEEVRAIVPAGLEIISLKEAGIDVDIPEPFETLEENAKEKARVIYDLTQSDCFSEDTGLEVYALGGEPGVKSARYAGEDKSFEKNIDKLLSKLEGIEDRRARFRAVITLIAGGKEFLFEGLSEGSILNQKRGQEGFGYDPVFVPDGSAKTFAEMGMAEKSLYSHRKKAMDKLVVFLNNLINNQ